MPVTRTYACLNARCRHEFDSSADHPPCPSCRGLRVQWVPRPVAIRSSVTAGIDKTARELAADFGLTNYRTPQRGSPAVTPMATPPAGGMTFEPQKGWRISLPQAALVGQGHAVCGPTGVTAKIKVDPNAGGLPENANYGVGRMRQHTRIEGVHSGKVPK